MLHELLAAALDPVQQDHLLEARQMQAMSFAVHIPIVCFGIAFPALVMFVEWLHLRTGDPVYRTLAKRWSKVAHGLRSDQSRTSQTPRRCRPSGSSCKPVERPVSRSQQRGVTRSKVSRRRGVTPCEEPGRLGDLGTCEPARRSRWRRCDRSTSRGTFGAADRR